MILFIVFFYKERIKKKNNENKNHCHYINDINNEFHEFYYYSYYYIIGLCLLLFHFCTKKYSYCESLLVLCSIIIVYMCASYSESKGTNTKYGPFANHAASTPDSAQASLAPRSF